MAKIGSAGVKGDKLVLSVGLLVVAAVISIVHGNDNLRTAFHWKQVDFKYPDEALRQLALSSRNYVPENVIPVGLEVYKNRLFLTLPRWKTGVPASLAYIDMNGMYLLLFLSLTTHKQTCS